MEAAAAAAKEETNDYVKKPQQRDDVTGLKTPLAKGDEPDTCFPSGQQLSQRSSLMINHLARLQAERTGGRHSRQRERMSEHFTDLE